ncbi:MAG: adenosylcobalamin-dependent ribonucleoside-diphosphate reductase [Candidatus Humimicrobiaceae bacterium]
MDKIKKTDSYYLKKEINLTENAIKVLERRYLKRDQKGELLEEPRDMFVRVAKNIASAESNYVKSGEEIKQIERKFFDIMADLDFLPNSPTLMNAGKELQQLAACFVLPVGDSMDEIFQALKETALIQKSGGGVGYSFSSIRPKNDVVLTTKGVSSGPISFMTVFNAATDTIKQGGTRRGANMGILRVDHPDILEFITSKEDSSKLNNFNISVGVTESFMKAVESGSDYEVINPRTKEVVDKYNAGEVFQKIVKNAWQNGDPGIIFLDRLNKDNPTPDVGQIESTNPCVTGDTLISTDKGLIKASDLHEKISKGQHGGLLFDRRALDYKANGSFKYSNFEVFEGKNIKSWYRGKKEVYRLVTESGYELDATGDHKVLTEKGYVRIKDLKMDEKVLIQPFGYFNIGKETVKDGDINSLNNFTSKKKLNLPERWTKELGEVLGWLVGDGSLADDRVGFTFGKEDINVCKYLNGIIKNWHNFKLKEIIRENGVIHLSYHSKGFIRFFKQLGIEAKSSPHKKVPDTLFDAPKEATVGFLRGVFSSGGNIDYPDGTIKLSSFSRELLKGIQILLLNVGIKSRILSRKYSFSQNFTYASKNYESDIENHYELFICGGISKKVFKKEIGFLNYSKQKVLDSLEYGDFSNKLESNQFIDKVKEVFYLGKKDVYDFNEPVSNSYIANGIVVKNCGEQPLLPYEACNLGSINLSHMVKEEAGKKAIDYEKLKETVHVSVRFLDDVIDMSRYPLDKINEMVKNNRKIGLGVMGFADMLILLGIPYNSEEALELAGEVMSFIQDESKRASKNLAKERGPFPNIKGSVYDSPDEEPVRNATTTTIAPTGSLSIIAGCSSGIEPIFAVSFTKNVMDNDKLVEVNPYFENVAKSEGFYSKELMKRIAENGSLDGIEEVPQRYRRIFMTAHQISPVWHVRMQAAFQKFVENAVSKTVNFPNSATEKNVEDVYMLAYRLGCKGITIYRDGSRDTQVLKVEGKKKEGKETAETEAYTGKIIPRPRPEVTEGMTKKFVIGGCGKLYVTVNSDEHGICEVFTNTGEEGCSALTEAIGRLISIGIRAGIEIDSIQKQLEGIRCITCIADNKTHVLSCPDAIGKAIEFYLKGINKFDLDVKGGPKSVMICPEENCGGIMEPEGGCYVCRNCGYSKCS